MKTYIQISKILSILLISTLCFSLIACGNASQMFPDNSSNIDEISSDDKVSNIDKSSELTSSESTSEKIEVDDTHTEPPITYTFNNLEEIASFYAAQQKGDDALKKYMATTEAKLHRFETVDDAGRFLDEIGNEPFPLLEEESGLRLLRFEYSPVNHLFVIFYQCVETDSWLRFVVYLNPEEFTFYQDWEPTISGIGEELSYRIYDLNTDGKDFTHVAVAQTKDYCFIVAIRADFPDGAEGLARVMEKAHLTTILEQIGE